MHQDTQEPTWSGLEELRPLVTSFARRRCHDQAEAEDVVQEALLRAACYRPSLEEPERLRAWVLRIAANVHRDWRRREVRYIHAENQEEWMHTLEGREGDGAQCVNERYRLGEFSVDEDEVLGQLPAALRELRSEDREALEFFYRGRESCLDLAQRLSISRSLAKVRVFRARKRLGKLLRKRLSLKRIPALPRACAS